jgi:hypothetical protein
MRPILPDRATQPGAYRMPICWTPASLVVRDAFGVCSPKLSLAQYVQHFESTMILRPAVLFVADQLGHLSGPLRVLESKCCVLLLILRCRLRVTRVTDSRRIDPKY